MRTTLTLDDDNADELRELAHRTHRPFKRVVNDVIRIGLAGGKVEETEAPYRVNPQAMGLRPGIDPARLSQLEAELVLDSFESTTGRLRREQG